MPAAETNAHPIFFLTAHGPLRRFLRSELQGTGSGAPSPHKCHLAENFPTQLGLALQTQPAIRPALRRLCTHRGSSASSSDTEGEPSIATGGAKPPARIILEL